MNQSRWVEDPRQQCHGKGLVVPESFERKIRLIVVVGPWFSLFLGKVGCLRRFLPFLLCGKRVFNLEERERRGEVGRKEIEWW